MSFVFGMLFVAPVVGYVMNDKEKFNKLKKERMHYYEMMNECRERIRVLNKEKK